MDDRDAREATSGQSAGAFGPSPHDRSGCAVTAHDARASLLVTETGKAPACSWVHRNTACDHEPPRPATCPTPEWVGACAAGVRFSPRPAWPATADESSA